MIDKPTTLVPVQIGPQPPGLMKRMGQAVAYALSGGYFSPDRPPDPSQQDTAGRRFDYPSGYNLYYQPRRDTGITFEQLRAFADNYDILRLIIETRKDQIAGFEWSIVSDDPEEVDNKKPPSPETKTKIAAVTEFFKKPDKRYPWHLWIRMVLEDLFVVDAITVWPTMKGSQLYALEVVDPSTIKILIDESGRRPVPPLPAYQQQLKGIPTSNFRADELLYYMRNPRSSKVYGFGPVEQIVMTVNIGLRRELSQLQFFTEGNIPEAIAGIPDNWTTQQIREFQTWWDSLMEGDTAARRHLKFIPGDASKVQMLKTSEDTLKTPYDEWLVRIMCYAFSTSPTPFVQQVNRATAETAQDVANEEGLVPLLDFIREMINEIIKGPMRMQGVQFRWNLQQDVDPMSQKDIDVQYIEHGVYSIDDVRQRLGLEPTGCGPMIWTGGGPVPVEMFVDGSAPSLQPPPPPPSFGEDPEDPEDPDDPDAAEGKPPASKQPPPKQGEEEQASKGVSARSAQPFRYGKSLVAQTIAYNRRGGRHIATRHPTKG